MGWGGALVIFLALLEPGILYVTEGEPLSRLPERGRMHLTSEQDGFRQSRRVQHPPGLSRFPTGAGRGIGAESIVVKGAVHLLSLRSGHDLAREMREMKRATVARTAFLKNSKCTATTLISWIADLLGPRVHQTMVREMHETRNPPQTVPSRSHRA